MVPLPSQSIMVWAVPSFLPRSSTPPEEVTSSFERPLLRSAAAGPNSSFFCLLVSLEAAMVIKSKASPALGVPPRSKLKSTLPVSTWQPGRSQKSEASRTPELEPSTFQCVPSRAITVISSDSALVSASSVTTAVME